MKSRLIQKLEKRVLDFKEGRSKYCPKYFKFIDNIIIKTNYYGNGLIPNSEVKPTINMFIKVQKENIKTLGFVINNSDDVNNKGLIHCIGSINTNQNREQTAEQRKRELDLKQIWNDNNKEYKNIWMELYKEKHNYGDRDGGNKGKWTIEELQRVMDLTVPTWLMAKELKRNVHQVIAKRSQLKKEKTVCIDINGRESSEIFAGK